MLILGCKEYTNHSQERSNHHVVFINVLQPRSAPILAGINPSFSLNRLILVLSTELIIHSLWRRADAQNVSFETFYGGLFTLPTRLIILKLSCLTFPPTKHHSFFRNLPPLILNILVRNTPVWKDSSTLLFARKSGRKEKHSSNYIFLLLSRLK